jgi:hypothetical protein
LQQNKPLNGLQEDADSNSHEKGSIEKRAKKLGSLPAEGKVCWGFQAFRYLL